MAKFSLIRGFKDPVTRPRYIIWSGVAAMVLVAVVVVALGVTSTRWFCAEVCHKVQDDAIGSYQASTHSEISCMACHTPVNADPVTFVMKKAKSLVELYLTATEDYEIPLNATSHVALSYYFQSKQCKQCHNLKNREVTPSKGIIISHEAHEKAAPGELAEEEYWNKIQCTWCHNRIAHNEEGYEPRLTDPHSGEVAHKHDDFMGMTACFRCHTLTDVSPSIYKAPGACAKCHPADFELKPANHAAKDFYPKGHAKTAKEDKEHAAEVLTEYEHKVEEGHADPLPPVGSVFYCATCHVENKFCMNCHGMEMPHPQEFKDKAHPATSKKQADKCTLCHAPAKTFFCDKCHHGAKSNWEFDAKQPWKTQHARTVTKNGVKGCLEVCHKEVKFCVDCHKTLKKVPSSHAAKDWLRKADADIGIHAANSKAEISGCQVCHGAGDQNKNSFCKGCHKYELPHPEEFKKFHSSTGKKAPGTCQYCHTYREVCSDCHHEGATNKIPWQKVHGPMVNKSGAGSCLEKCHKAEYCVQCHTSLKVVPASHKGTWTRDVSAKQAVHATTFEKQPESCDYCHGKKAPNGNKFCKGCHKVDMPHPDGYSAVPEGAKAAKGQGGQHAEAFAKKQTTVAVCNNCHNVAFCNGCHHQYTGAKRWVNFHPGPVKKSGATACFVCHEETFCSYCHVRRAQEFIKR